VIDPGEKERLYLETIARNKRWISLIARNNAPINSWHDLEQDIRLAFWKAMEGYDGKSSALETWFFSVAQNAIRYFRRTTRNMEKRDAAFYSNQEYIEQDRDRPRLIEELMRELGKLDQQILKMHLEDFSYPEMSAALGFDEVNLRKRMSRIRQQLKPKYKDR
jgi:RNA polymerase sigma factor (sigma-70 family)